MKREQYLRIAAVLMATKAVVEEAAGEEENTCLLCGDGTNNVVTVDDSSPFDGVSCQNFVESANNVGGDTEECELIQLAAFQGECCETISADHSCSMCPGSTSSIANPDREVHPSFLSADTDYTPYTFTTCNDLHTDASAQLEFLRLYLDSPGVCDNTLLRRSAGWCGCEGVEEECALCNDDVEPEEDLHHPLTGMSCNTDIAYQVSLLHSDQCPDMASYLGYDARALCCPGEAEPPSICPICSPTQSIVEDVTFNTEAFGEVTCADIQEAAKFIPTDAICQTFRQEQVPLAFLCCEEWQDAVQAERCELLCEDGMPLPDIFKTDPVSRHSCDSLAREFSKIPKAQCDNAAFLLGFDAHAFCCGAPPISNACEPICPQGQELLHPHRILYSYQDHTCEAVGNSLAFVVGGECNNLLDESRVLQNCPCRIPESDTLPPPLDDDDTNRGGISSATGIQAAGILAILSCMVMIILLVD